MFCDKGTPIGSRFNVYDELRDRLAAAGLDPARVRYIHEANTDQAKERLFAACRNGDVDVLIGSTEKMGVGTNIQARLVALHHLDARGGPPTSNNAKAASCAKATRTAVVHVVRYVTEGSFDPYMWQNRRTQGPVHRPGHVAGRCRTTRPARSRTSTPKWCCPTPRSKRSPPATR